MASLILGVLLLRAGAAEPEILTTVSQFWDLSEAAKQRSHPVRMDLKVYYHDAAWNLLYGNVNGVPSYFPVHGRPMPIKAGQKIRLEGTVTPAQGFDGDQVRVTILGDGGLLPEPVQAAGRLDNFSELRSQWVEFEGYVFTQHEPDATHIESQVLCEGRVVHLTVQLSGTEPVPQLVGARIRFRGVYDAVRDPNGRPQEIQCWTPRREFVEVMGWLNADPRFQLAVTPIDRLESVGAATWVRVLGEVRSQEPGKSLTVRDDTGQIVVATTQPQLVPAGAMVEIIGRPVPAELGWSLAEPLFRLTTDATPRANPAGQAPFRLRLAEQVVQLPPEEADRHYPVSLRGVVTWFDERADYFYFQDSSGGIRVRRPRDSGPWAAGTQLVLRGVTTRGALISEMEMSEATVAGAMALPSTRRISLDQALSGSEEARWVEMRGYVRRVAQEGNWTRIDLTAGTGEFTAFLPPDLYLQHLQDSIVRVRGVCVATTNANREITGVRVWLQNRDAISVDEPPPAAPFAIPLQTVGTLRTLLSAQPTERRLHTSGVLLLHHPGRDLYLQDTTGALLVLTRETINAQPGDWIEVVGLGGRAGNRLALREAVWRPTAPGIRATPRELLPDNLLEVTLDTRLVRVRALLRRIAIDGAETQLTLETGGNQFEALLATRDFNRAIEPGSDVELTGVYLAEFDEYRQPRSFHLELRDANDLRVLATPPWWNLQRTLYGMGAVVLLAAAILAWGITLRRRVRAQTEQIRLQMEKEAQLQSELERSTRLESLGVLAGGIAHDFNNLLTTILGNLGLAAMDKRVMTAAGDCIVEAERGARRARDIAQQLLTFAKGGDPVRASVALPDVVSEAASFARQGSSVRFDFKYPHDLPNADVDAGQISRVVHNLVINAVQAMPEGGVVSIALASTTVGAGEVATLEPGRYILMTVTDSGKGVPPEVLPKIFDPYFSLKAPHGGSGLGLATVRSIVRKHNGHIEAESQAGQGTVFRIWLPAAAKVSSKPSPAEVAAPATPARILVMDDEEAVRRVMARVLSLAGHEVVFAFDGAEAVRLYAESKESGRPFDLVILDLTVPGGMGGRDALQEMLKLSPEVRAVASSGYSSDAVMANPTAYGFRTALPKPYDIPDVIRAIGEARRP